MSNDSPPSYVVALADERAMYARSVHPDRAAMVDEELAAQGWAVDGKGVPVKLSEKPVEKKPEPVTPRAHKERAVSAPPEKAVDRN